MTATPPPILFTFDGESMVPKAPRLADRFFAVGEVYPLVVHEPRSQASHNHYFASVQEAWRNLPEDLAVEFPTADHLRKFALIKAGYCDKRSEVCSSKAEAQRFRAFIQPIDDYAIVTATECVVTVYTAKSQSKRAMGASEFQKSKDAVLDIVSAMVGVSKPVLQDNAGKAA